MRKFYSENAKGPARYEVSAKLSFERYQEDCEIVVNQMKTYYDSQIQEARQKAVIAQNLHENAKLMLREEKERHFEESKVLREKHQRERMELDGRVDELRLELNKRDDSNRRLEFEVEKAMKLVKQLQEKPLAQEFSD